MSILRKYDNANDTDTENNYFQYFRENLSYEIINGKIICMAPEADPNHGTISFNLGGLFYMHLRGKPCKIYHDNNYLRIDLIAKQNNIDLPQINKLKDKYKPDLMVICDKSIDTPKGITGAPKLIVEVLSPKYIAYDREIKKNIYEAIGVYEYWIVSPSDKTIEIYILSENGKYTLCETYFKYSEADIENIKDRKEFGIEDEEIITEFTPKSFPDLTIRVDDVFDKLI